MNYLDWHIAFFHKLKRYIDVFISISDAKVENDK